MTWKMIGKTKWGEPVLKNEYSCIFEGGCGNAPNGQQCGECYGKDGCPVLKEMEENERKS